MNRETPLRTTVSDVMTTDPIAVTAGTSYKHIAEILGAWQISAVPVIDDEGAPVGVVSEADLLAKVRATQPRKLAGARARHDRSKSRALVAADLMTSPARTIGAGSPVAAAANKLAGAGIKRLFVVADGKLVGVVSRRDLLKAFRRSDELIREDIEREVFQQALEVRPGMAAVTVEDGVATLIGRLDCRGDVARAGLLAASVPGVVELRNRLDFVWDDNGERPLHPALLGM
ncbi:CBS domain-containing protein [Amycolatopsis sp. NPDC059657]|uniref:CBS domain-containing protein n=1 Tax=Amycolatopsis sp. NPDC059657 TaxID=3346899 RepID=UPI00366B6565